MKIVNKKATFNYELLDRLEAGIILSGSEVKSIRNGRCNLSDAFVKILSNELWLVNCEIPQYKYDSDELYDSTRSRKLLVNRKELNTIESKIKQGNLTVVPVAVYTVRDKIKVEIALARGKKHYEKKLQEKERDLNRELLRDRRKFMV